MILPVNWVRHERQVVLRTDTPHAAARSRGAGGRREQGIRKKITEMKMRLKDPGGAKPISGPARRLIEYMAVVRGLRGPRASGICITMYAGPVSELGVEIYYIGNKTIGCCLFIPTLFGNPSAIGPTVQ